MLDVRRPAREADVIARRLRVHEVLRETPAEAGQLDVRDRVPLCGSGRGQAVLVQVAADEGTRAANRFEITLREQLLVRLRHRAAGDVQRLCELAARRHAIALSEPAGENAAPPSFIDLTVQWRGAGRVD